MNEVTWRLEPPKRSMGDRNFAKTSYAKLNPEVAARAMALHGYRQVSNKFRMVARIHHTEDQMKSKLRRELRRDDNDDFYDEDPGGWQDFYRRCYATDVIRDVPDNIMRMTRNLIDYREPCF